MDSLWGGSGAKIIHWKSTRDCCQLQPIEAREETTNCDYYYYYYKAFIVKGYSTNIAGFQPKTKTSLDWKTVC